MQLVAHQLAALPLNWSSDCPLQLIGLHKLHSAICHPIISLGHNAHFQGSIFTTEQLYFILHYKVWVSE
jgi:hypothetical protein